MTDRLIEIEGRGWYDQGPDDFKWMIEEIRRLRGECHQAVMEVKRLTESTPKHPPTATTT